jgi:hypothetical protein
MSIEEFKDQKACDVIIQYSIPDLVSSVFKTLPSLDCPEGYELNKTWGDAIKCSLATDCNGSVHIRGVSNNIEEMVFPQSSFLSGYFSSSKSIIRDSLQSFNSSDNEVSMCISKSLVCVGRVVPLAVYAGAGAVLGSLALGSVAEVGYNALAEKIVPALSLVSGKVSDEAIAKMSELSYMPVFLAPAVGAAVGASAVLLGVYAVSDPLECAALLAGNQADVSIEA